VLIRAVFMSDIQCQTIEDSSRRTLFLCRAIFAVIVIGRFTGYHRAAMRTTLLAGAVISLIVAGAAEKPLFREQEVDAKVEIGYGLAIADVNGDGKKDILLADKNVIVWYENPSWTKHVMAEKLTALDHVCIAAMDIDGDGKAEVVAGAGWNPGDTVNSGALFYLIPSADRTQKWEPVALHHEPTVHRIKWAKGADGKYGLVSIPLHGRGNKNNEGAGVKHEFYHVPKDVKSEWPRTVIDEEMHASHNFNVTQWDSDPAEELLIAGKEGIFLYDASGDSWKKKVEIAKTGEQGFAGAGEARNGKLSSGQRFIAAIEPMHGTNVVAYLETTSGPWRRMVLDTSVLDGHAIAVGDFLGRGYDQFIAGWRGKTPGVKLFAPDPEGTSWTPQMIDPTGMACEDLAAADLNGDGKLDLIAAGRATKNLKIYWNEAR
jgi:hypothetical protein